MRSAGRALRLTVRIGLLVAMLSGTAFVVLRPYLDDDERIFNEGRIDTVTKQGPVTVGHVEYKLDSLKVYTKLADTDGEEISMDAPAGSAIVVAMLDVTPREGVFLKDKGFSCGAALRDDRGNMWSSQQPFGFKYPTYCTDDDHPFTMDKAQQVAQVYVVPASAVPHLTGVVVEKLDERRRVLLTP